MGASFEFKPHEIEWTREKAIRVWDYLSRNSEKANQYFSYQVGDVIIDYAARHINLRHGLVLDFGCGPGFLTEKLAQRRIAVEAIDFSESSVATLRERLSHHASFRAAYVAEGIPTPLRAERYDTVFFLETIEHLIGDELDQTLGELARVTARGGHVVVTTRNEEDLDADKHLCPECGCIFHRVQHTSSWTAQTLRKALERHGFTAIRCEARNFRRPNLVSRVLEVGSRVLRTKPINLVYLGRRR